MEVVVAMEVVVDGKEERRDLFKKSRILLEVYSKRVEVMEGPMEGKGDMEVDKGDMEVEVVVKLVNLFLSRAVEL